MSSKSLPFVFALALSLLSLPVPQSGAQTVTVGQGSYRTSVPSGERGVQNISGQNLSPKVSSGFSKPAQSNDFWSSLIFPFRGDPFSNVLNAHPLNAKAASEGLRMGYTTQPIFPAADYLYEFKHQLTVGVSGLTASQATTDDYGDWTVTALWESGARSMRATLGHGLPFVFFRMDGGDAVLSAQANPNIWYNQDGVLGLTIAGVHYGVFAPTGSTWSGTSTLQSSLDGKGYLSVALLPDNATATLDLFRQHAYAFVTDSRVSWEYDEPTAVVTSTFAYETEFMEDNGTSVDQTMTALYRHQWLHTSDPLTGHDYASPRGSMKLLAGSTFTTEHRFSGMLPALPDEGDYNPGDLLALVQEAAAETLPLGGTYDNGKAMGRFANLVHIADQLGATAERDHFLSEIKRRLEDWFTAGGDSEYAYQANWDVMTGYPSGFGADDQINDHHFHAAYAVMSAATVAQFDPVWAAPENWGGMVNLLIKDANNWDRTDEQFPFLRSHDAYAGHSWAAGHADFGDGNNQESSSESINFASSVILWGANTGQQEIRDMGVFLHATETSAVEQYWFDVDDAVFPAQYPHVAIGMVWGGKGVHSTWFGADTEFIHGINILPITGGSLYLGRHPDHIVANYDEVVDERNSQPIQWKDIFWEYLALSDPDRALSYYFADPDYEPFDGESRAHTMHWLYNLKKMGHLDTTIVADVPTFAVFRDGADELTYVAYNAKAEEEVVSFSDGFTLTVPARSMTSESTATTDPNAPVALLQTNKTQGKVPLTIQFEASKSFDRNESPLTFEWDFAGLGGSTKADTSFTFTDVGEYWVRLSVTNGVPIATRDSVMITVLGNGTPYSGTAFSVPGRIEAERYDKGGEGLAYHDADANNIGLAFRPNEGVDITGSSVGSYAVYWIVAGEWIEYTIDVPDDGLYNFSPAVATVPGFGTFTLLLDGEDISGTKAVRSTGGFEFFQQIPVNNVPVTAGEHILRVEADSESDKTGWLFSLNWIDVTKSSGTGVDDSGLPTDFELAQNYPNPFNPSSEIQYALPRATDVRLEVFNSLGQRVQVLVNAYQEAGRHAVSFDGTSLTTGVYLYRISTPHFVSTRRMLLVK